MPCLLSIFGRRSNRGLIPFERLTAFPGSSRRRLEDRHGRLNVSFMSSWQFGLAPCIFCPRRSYTSFMTSACTQSMLSLYETRLRLSTPSLSGRAGVCHFSIVSSKSRHVCPRSSRVSLFNCILRTHSPRDTSFLKTDCTSERAPLRFAALYPV